MQSDKIGISFMEFRTVAGLKLLVEEIKSGAPNDGFLLNTLTTLFRLYLEYFWISRNAF